MIKVNEELFYLAAHFSACAYKPENPRSIFFCNEKTSTSAFLWRLPKFDILAFKGTGELLDWWYNVRSFPWKYGSAWSHRGFCRAHKSIWPTIAPNLDPRKPTLITGHSLGGALAEKSVEFCKDFVDLHLITFGKPNLYFMPNKHINSHLATQLSVVHGSDIVARIPKFLFAPDPGQDMLYLSNSGRNYLNPPKKFRVQDWGFSDFISDHSMKPYLSRMSNLGEVL